MDGFDFTEEDVRQIIGHGKTVDAVKDEICRFEKGFGYPDIVASASVGNGILRLSDPEVEDCMSAAESFSGKIVKFVPASGAATRMFKDLFAGLDEIVSGRQMNAAAARFVERFEEFPFASGCRESSPEGKLRYVLSKDGLDYGNTPKGLVVFHSYGDDRRTAFAEHFVEGAMYACSGDGVVRMHFTVSPEHMDGFRNELDRIRPVYENRFGCRYDVSFSVQDPSTDTIAVNTDNTPFRTSSGRLLFRPAGHGALIRNLGAVDADMIVVKNIDNVTVEGRLSDTVKWKKVLMGYLVRTVETLRSHTRRLRQSLQCGLQDAAPADEAGRFMSSVFGLDCALLEKSSSDRLEYCSKLLSFMDRPVRVCGMVRNEGAPGGGPFIVREKDGTISLQILESSQVNLSDDHCRKALEASTHFNPVDIVCCTKDCDGNRYDLSRFVDSDAGFISSKSHEGRPLKALELPGLWNGAMSRWNTVFVEVPVSTFNPVKTVMDLLGR